MNTDFEDARAVTLTAIALGFKQKDARTAKQVIRDYYAINGYTESFETIVSVNCGEIHGDGVNRRLVGAKSIIIDTGVNYAGGKTDFTRTVVDASLRKEYLIVQGMFKVLSKSSVFEAEVNYTRLLKECGYEQKHKVGHLVKAHEIHAGGLEKVRIGDGYTIEPGVYADGWGIRHEDTFLYEG